MSVWEDAQQRARAEKAQGSNASPGEPFSGNSADGECEIWREDLRGTVIPLSRHPRLARWRSSRRLRATAAGVALIVALALILGVPSALVGMLAAHRGYTGPTHVTHTVTANLPPAFYSIVHEDVPVPVEAAGVPWMHIAPVNGANNTATICWTDNPAADPAAPPSQVHSAVTTNGGATWHTLRLPSTAGASCAIASDSSRPSGVLLTIYQSNPATDDSGGCELPQLYHSANLGQSWQAVIWPANLQYACGLHTSLEDGELYAWATSPLWTSNGESSEFIHTADDGHTWHVPNTHLVEEGTLQVVGQRPQGKLLVTTADVGKPYARELWQSVDDGATWQSEGALPGANPTVYVSTDPAVTSSGGWGQLYEIAQSETNGVPDGRASDYVATATLGHGWQPLPAPPQLLALASDPFHGQILGVAVTPGGALVVARGAPDTATAAIAYARFVLLWQPARRQWQLDSNRLPTNSIADGIASAQGKTLLWSIFVALRGTHAFVHLNVRGYPASAGG